MTTLTAALRIGDFAIEVNRAAHDDPFERQFYSVLAQLALDLATDYRLETENA